MDLQHKISLDPKVRFRSRLIFGILTVLVLASLTSGIYFGVKNNKFYQIFIEPFNEIGEELSKEASPSGLVLPTPTASPSATPTPTKKVTPKVQYPTPVGSNCTRKSIREGEFASNKCYTEADFEDLNYYLNQYNSAVSSVSFYETKVSISCGNNDFFKTCEQDKKDQQANLDNIPRYRSIIQGIIAKGR